MLYNNAIELIGNTPILKVNNLIEDANLYVKLEKFNASASVKDRAVLGMIELAEKNGDLKKGQTIVEPSSGNTGIALAMIGCLKGYNIVITMPESMSKERRDIIKAYGAELILTDASLGMKGSIEKANELVKNNGYIMLQQFENLGNPYKHYLTTVEEILIDIPDVAYIVVGVGTGGTIMGIAKKIKEKNLDIKIVAVEPFESAILSGEKSGKHKIQGIGAGFIPKIYDENLIDKIIKVKSEDALIMSREYTKSEGVLIGISSGAAIFAAIELINEIGKDKKVVVVAPDGGEKYFSTGLYE